MTLLKSLLKNTPVYFIWRLTRELIKNKNNKSEQVRLLKEWEVTGRPLPPPQLYKRLVIKNFAVKNKINVFVETGTYMGETLSYFRNYFKQLFSIELDQKLYNQAKKKFARKPNIQIYQGDSGDVLQRILMDISEPCIFWLDGHYSEGITAKGKLNTPILQELQHIFNHKVEKHIVLIDDARCFNGNDDYPTIEFLENYVRQKKSNLKFIVKDDIIRIYE